MKKNIIKVIKENIKETIETYQILFEVIREEIIKKINKIKKKK